MYKFLVTRVLRRVVVALGLLPLVGAAAQAYEVSPVRAEVEPFGAKSSTVIEVSNPRSAPLLIELSGEYRAFAADGEASLSPTDHLMVFPPLAQIPPGGSQALMVRYVGPSEIAKSESYVVRITEVPAENADAQFGVQIAYAFGAALYVVPPGAQPMLEIRSVGPAAGGAVMEIANTGSTYGRLSDFTLVDASGTEVASGADLSQAGDFSVIQPGTVQRVTFEGIKLSATAGLQFVAK